MPVLPWGSKPGGSGLYLPLTGGTLTGALTVSANLWDNALLVNNNYSILSGNYLPVFSALAPNMANGSNMQFIVGKAASTNNEAQFTFNYVSSGSASNSMKMGLYGNGVTTLFGNGVPASNNSSNLGSSSLYWSNLYASRYYLNSTAYLDGGTAGAVSLVGDFGMADGSFIKSNGNLIIGSNGFQTLIRPGSSGNSIQFQNFAGSNTVSVTDTGVIMPIQAATASAPTYVEGGIYFDTTLSKLRVGGAAAWETITSA